MQDIELERIKKVPDMFLGWAVNLSFFVGLLVGFIIFTFEGCIRGLGDFGVPGSVCFGIFMYGVLGGLCMCGIDIH